MQTSLSVILCTYNPRPEYLSRVLESLPAQTLSLNNGSFCWLTTLLGNRWLRLGISPGTRAEGTFAKKSLRNVITNSGGKHLARGLLPSMPNKKGKGPNVDSIKRRKSPFISDRIFKNIERRRWFAALDDAA
jgi:hypothetical protein